MKTKLTLIIISILLISACSSSTDPAKPIVQTPGVKNPYDNINSVHVTLGVPFDSDTTNDFIIVRNQYVLSYNKNTNICNWVSYELNATWFGDVERYDGNFFTDTSLPAGYYRVTHADYTNSGYDRGHMVRSEERTATEADNKSTFILTNVIPQTPDLNRGVWLDFEYYCEDLCKKEAKELFVITGPINHTFTKIKEKLSVPDSCFKIVIVLDKGQSLPDVNQNTQVIAVVMPNIDGVRTDDWEKYKSTIRRIEGSTGYDFLSKIPKSLQDVLEVK